MLETTEEYCKLRINKGMYPKETLYAAAYAFLDRAYVLLDEEGDQFVIYLYKKQAAQQECGGAQPPDVDLKTLGMQFTNELNNFNNYLTNLRENKDVVKLLIERAMFSANPGLIEEAEQEEVKKLLEELEQDEDPELREIAKELKNAQ